MIHQTSISHPPPQPAAPQSRRGPWKGSGRPMHVIGCSRLLSDPLASSLASLTGCDGLRRFETPADATAEAAGRNVLSLVDADLIALHDALDYVEAVAEEGRVVLCYGRETPVEPLRRALVDGRLHSVSALDLDASFAELALAVSLVAAESSYFAPRIVRSLVRSEPPGEATPCPLTEREREILGHVAAGLSNRAIARDLSITEHTVKLHVHNIHRKLGVRNRTAAAGWYLSRQA